MMMHVLHEMAQWNWGGIAFVVLILPASGYMTHLLRVWSMREPKAKEKPRRAIELGPASVTITNPAWYLTRELIAHKMMPAAKVVYVAKSPGECIPPHCGSVAMSEAEFAFMLAQPRRKG